MTLKMATGFGNIRNLKRQSENSKGTFNFETLRRSGIFLTVAFALTQTTSPYNDSGGAERSREFFNERENAL